MRIKHDNAPKVKNGGGHISVWWKLNNFSPSPSSSSGGSWGSWKLNNFPEIRKGWHSSWICLTQEAMPFPLGHAASRDSPSSNWDMSGLLVWKPKGQTSSVAAPTLFQTHLRARVLPRTGAGAQSLAVHRLPLCKLRKPWGIGTVRGICSELVPLRGVQGADRLMTEGSFMQKTILKASLSRARRPGTFLLLQRFLVICPSYRQTQSPCVRHCAGSWRDSRHLFGRQFGTVS